MLANFFSFQGRVTRSKLWLLILASVVFAIIYNLALYMTGAFQPDGVDASSGGGVASLVVWFLVVLVGIAFAICGLSYQVRRCHDRDRSGWFVLLWVLPILNIWGFVELYCLAGTPGVNRFGADPSRRGFAQTAETFR